MIFGYARVSTAEQSVERQVRKFEDLGIVPDCIFIDKSSGKDFQREQYQVLKLKLREFDLVYLDSLDRLGRSYDAIQDEWRHITHVIGADIVVLEQEALFDSRKFKAMGDIGKVLETQFLSLLSYIADLERKKLLTRQREGIEVAKSKGVRFGRPYKPLTREQERIIGEWREGKISAVDAMRLTGLKKTAFYRKAKKYEGR
ncbi:MAG: recombinase family protein [Symbiobacteriaceae bacterium]|nr:recombinase family protein [Symbiobacteriaceae bacterium]